MRIVYLSGSAIPSRRANSIQVMRMCEAFGRNGHDVTLVGKQSEGSPVEDVYDYYGVRKCFQLSLIPCRTVKGSNILVLPALYARLRRHDPNEVLIYARDIYGASLAIRMGFRVIYEAHSPPYNPLIRHLERSLFGKRRLLRFVVISQALADFYAARFDIADRVTVCHDAAAVPSESSNGELSWPPCRDTLQVGYAGHLYPGRGIDIIIECAKRLPHYDFHVIGGDDEDILYWKLRASVNLHFHGFVEPALIPSACSRCDVLLMPYQTDLVLPYTRANTSAWMSPLKLFQYMASRKAVVSSDLPVLREVLDERMAVLVPPEDTDRWVDAIQRCENRSYRSALAEAAYNAFREHYTWGKRAERVLSGVAW
ncbi:MAG: glycosyltransferase family 4 protein [Sedimentisphaerales bacterium]|jgi:glycosyltransferase involved in cell wall biosynthesis|nr:glycosyltransferase family 4 protein [Sedimentisphaerales bacterium]HOH63400.1 glycosyltransferase family 4 protein [Sedimentisphaerales bacterium]HQN34346.1 glycosyltransferase family 4 protein [Sedimentisphaerales bacterium]